MKPYRVLKDFAGNQTGNGETQYFKAGETAMLSDHLAEVVLKAGYVEPAGKEKAAAPKKAAAAPEPAPAPEAEPEPGDEVSSPAQEEDRETKVAGPEETKPAPKKSKKG